MIIGDSLSETNIVCERTFSFTCFVEGKFLRKKHLSSSVIIMPSRTRQTFTFVPLCKLRATMKKRGNGKSTSTPTPSHHKSHNLMMCLICWSIFLTFPLRKALPSPYSTVKCGGILLFKSSSSIIWHENFWKANLLVRCSLLPNRINRLVS